MRPTRLTSCATERKINALWQAIDRAMTSGDWRPRQSKLCDWCAFQALCPAFGGVAPPLPEGCASERSAPEAASLPEAGSWPEAGPETQIPAPRPPDAV